MLDVMEVAKDADDVVVGDFCSILISVGVPANEVASRLLDVVISDTWHGSRLIWRRVAVVCVVVSADGQLP